MGHVVKMKATKDIKQRAKTLAGPAPAPAPKQQWAKWKWPPLKEMRPYDVVWLASEVMSQITDYTSNGILDKEYGFYFWDINFELENLLDSGVLGYLNGDPPYKKPEKGEEEPSAS